MKISEVTTDILKQYLRIDYADDDVYIQNIIMPASKQFILSYTGLELDVIDTKEDLTIAFMVLCTNMYSNKDYIVQEDKVNVVVKTILDKYCINLL